MKYRILGAGGSAQAQLKVSALGLGCMGMSEFYGEPCEHNKISDQNSARTILRAIDLGFNFFDTADEYGCGHNEELLGRTINTSKNRRDQIILATKCGVTRDTDNSQSLNKGVNNSPAYIKAACDASLKRLGVDYIDLFYLHRFDPVTPIEESVSAMASLVAAGKVRCLGLSKITADVLRKAHAVHPITAVQMEYSLWSTAVAHNGVLALCKEAGIGLVAYSPLGRSFLTGAIANTKDMETLSSGGLLPRFQEGQVGNNFKLIVAVGKMAAAKKCTPSQLALAWLLAKEDFIVPIPGTKKADHLEENLYAVENVALTPNEIASLDELSSQYRGKI